jgi:hypothetical protein
MAPKFTLYTVENVITEESAAHGDYASSDATEEHGASLREVIEALESDCWDNIDERSDGTIICYPADYVQNYRTGEWSAEELIIHARRPEWADRAMALYDARRKARRF